MTVLRAAPTLREASQAIADFAWSAIRLIDTPEAAQHLQAMLNDLRAALAHPPEPALREAPLPELPTARFSVLHNDSPFGAPRDLSVYTAEQMQEYARAALAHPPEVLSVDRKAMAATCKNTVDAYVDAWVAKDALAIGAHKQKVIAAIDALAAHPPEGAQPDIGDRRSMADPRDSDNPGSIPGDHPQGKSNDQPAKPVLLLPMMATDGGLNPYFEGCFDGESLELANLRRSLVAERDQAREGAQPEPVAIQSDVLADASQRLLGIVAYLTDNKTPNRDMPVSAELRYIAKRIAGALPAVPQERTPERYWQHDETGRICVLDHSPGAKWFEIAEPVPAAHDAHKQVAVLKFNDGHAELVDHWTGRFMASAPKAEDAVWLAKRVNAAALPAPSVPASDLDAMRYRFLRNQKDWGGWYWDGSNNMFHGEDLDTAIDDAMDAPSSLGSASPDSSVHPTALHGKAVQRPSGGD